MRLETTDDSGFLALIDPDAYSGFVGSEWDFRTLLDRFKGEMIERRLLIWGTGQEGCWTVEVTRDQSPVTGLREVRGSIISTRGRLGLTNYESLTMAAQSSDVTLPEKHQADLVVMVPPGPYRCRVVQMCSEAHGWDKGKSPEFLVELTPALELERVWDKIPWIDD